MFRSKDIELPDAEAAPLMHEPSTVCDSSGGSGQRRHLFAWSCGSLVGPGMIVSLADTDAACLIVAADSGARWGYSLLLLQLLLIPVLFMAQELTIRLGVHTRKGHTACIKARFGAFWAHVTCAALVMSCIGATVSEMSGIASVGELWGLSRVASTSVAAVLLVSVVVCGKYRQVEAIGIALGLFECAFILTMLMARPSLAELARGLATVHAEPSYYKLVAANIGAVIMPWMIYFQQSAIVAKGLSTPQHEARERTDTLCGALLTQLIMISTLITMAATRHVTHTVALTNVLPLRSSTPRLLQQHTSTHAPAESSAAHQVLAPHAGTHTHTRARAQVAEMADAMAVSFGPTVGRVLLSLGLAGGSLCAAFVVALAAAWGVCEARNDFRADSLDLPVRREAPAPSNPRPGRRAGGPALRPARCSIEQPGRAGLPCALSAAPCTRRLCFLCLAAGARGAALLRLLRGRRAARRARPLRRRRRRAAQRRRDARRRDADARHAALPLQARVGARAARARAAARPTQARVRHALHRLLSLRAGHVVPRAEVVGSCSRTSANNSHSYLFTDMHVHVACGMRRFRRANANVVDVELAQKLVLLFFFSLRVSTAAMRDDERIVVGKTPFQAQAVPAPLAFDPDKALTNFGDDKEMLSDMLNVCRSPPHEPM